MAADHSLAELIAFLDGHKIKIYHEAAEYLRELERRNARLDKFRAEYSLVQAGYDQACCLVF